MWGECEFSVCGVNGGVRLSGAPPSRCGHYFASFAGSSAGWYAVVVVVVVVVLLLVLGGAAAGAAAVCCCCCCCSILLLCLVAPFSHTAGQALTLQFDADSEIQCLQTCASSKGAREACDAQHKSEV